MTPRTEKIEKSNKIMTNQQTEVKTVKEDTKTYKQWLGAGNPGKLVSVPEKFALGICIRGIPEKNAETASADNRLLTDFAEVEAPLKFLNIEDGKLVKIQRLGKYDRNKNFPRTFLENTEKSVSRDLVLRAAFKLKGYNRYENAVYISTELNSTDAKKAKRKSKSEKLLESSENKLTSKEIRVGNFTLEVPFMKMRMIQTARKMV